MNTMQRSWFLGCWQLNPVLVTERPDIRAPKIAWWLVKEPMGVSSKRQALNLSPAGTICLPLPLHLLLNHKGTEEPELVFVQCLLAAECPTYLLNAFLDPLPHLRGFQCQVCSKKVPLQVEFEQRKFPSLVLSCPAFQLFGSVPGPCLHPFKLTTMLIIILPYFCIVLCTFQSILMYIILFATATREKRQEGGIEDNTYHLFYPIHPP